jgi:CBS-domain-containing membrane protein
MTVRDIMTAGTPTVTPDWVVADVARVMLEKHLPALPVVNTDGTLLGMVRRRDLVARHARVHVPFYLGFLGAAIPFQSPREDEEIRHALAVTAQELMETNVKTVGPGDSVEDAATILVDDETEAVPVLENGAVVGLVTDADMLRLLVVEESDGTAAGQ